jgi:hypothetical protein
MVMFTQELMLERLSQLRERHRALDSTITSMVGTTACNQLELQRLKREKLALKDEIARIEDELYPDIIA